MIAMLQKYENVFTEKKNDANYSELDSIEVD